jgi:hypothetical protein
VYFQSFNGTTWSAPTDLAIASTNAAPAITTVGNGNLMVAARDAASGNIMVKRWGCFILSCTWEPNWTSVGAPPGGTASAAPAIAGIGTDRSYMVYVHGSDGRLWGRTWCQSCNAFGNWFVAYNLTMAVGTAPAVINTQTVGSQQVFVTATNGQLYAIQAGCSLGCGFNNTAGWTPLGGTGLTGSPTAVQTNGWVTVLVNDAAGVVNERVYVPYAGWYGWGKISTSPGLLNPAATSSGSNAIQLFVTSGSSNNLQLWNFTP